MQAGLTAMVRTVFGLRHTAGARVNQMRPMTDRTIDRNAGDVRTNRRHGDRALNFRAGYRTGKKQILH
jgi:hypothetical protein